MSDLSSYLGVFRAQGADERRKVTKRNRQPVSCAPCRQKKLKCDRQQPCAACVKREDAASCEFGATATIPPPKQKDKARSEAQARLQKLEEMVNGLLQSRVSEGGSVGKEKGVVAERNGDVHEKMQRLKVSHSQANKLRGSTGYYLSSQDTETSFVGPTHWIAILEGINDLKGYLDSDNLGSPSEERTQTSERSMPTTSSRSPESSASGLSPASARSSPIKHDMIIGPYEPLTIQSALEALPERKIVDNLLGVYFTCRYFTVPFLHSKKFQRDYQAFRDNPYETPMMFISMLFSILSVASGIVVASGKAGSWSDSSIDARTYMHKAGQAIVAGEYLRAQPFVIEALLLHTHSKFMRTVDSEPSLWSLTGLVVRLAQKLGMHRDPARLSQPISPFNAEIRRRIWFHVETFDLLMSMQLGMPPIINGATCDIGHPKNLLVTDFDEDSAELPPERSEHEESPMLFVCYKSRFIRLFRHIITHALNTIQPEYTETMTIDGELRRLYGCMPKRLRIVPISEAPFSDTTEAIMKRLMLEMLYLKGLLILHRNFLTYGKDDPKFNKSREIAISSALEQLRLQEEYDAETSPGGRMYEDRWMMSSLTLHDFLMSAMVVCLDLSELPQKNHEERERKIGALRTSYRIWSAKRSISRDADHAANVIAAMLAKVTMQDPSSRFGGSTATAGSATQQRRALRIQPSSTTQTPTAQAAAKAGSQHQAASVLDNGGEIIPAADPKAQAGALDDQVLVQQMSDSPFSDDSFEFMDLDSFDEMLSNTDNLDWNLIDQYLRDPSNNPDQSVYFQDQMDD